ncbi:TetR/AcrR family transcriptional regulator [Actinoplanes friuliensis]|uniref:TetR/AcrR family transcriptional regulator n=1 Tax=Actinoplanes friuliensis TaxID=196914 RepID=UPI00069397E3|nr:TetR/AcrR family transcriptional regulator [Actinoplanes friuliensis]
MARTAAPGTRERIVAAAAPLFYTQGIRAVGMAQVVEAAGCGKNLLYTHFPAKTDLVAAYLSLVRGERERSTGRAVQGARGPEEALIAVLGEIADRVREPGFRGCAMRNYLTEFPTGDDAPDRIARDYLASTEQQIRDLSRDDTLADRLWLVVESLYAVAGRPDAPARARVAVDLATELVGTG